MGWFLAGGGKKTTQKKGVVASYEAILGRFFGVIWAIFALMVAAAGRRIGFSLFFLPRGAAGRRRHENRTAVAFWGAIL